MAPDSYSHVIAAEEYAAAVVELRQIACMWIRLACKMYFDDIARSSTDWPYEFDADRAEQACEFIEQLPHVKGKWARERPGHERERLKLEPWQCFLVCMVFGWVRKLSDDDRAAGVVAPRRYQKVRVYLPRKNGKSTTAAGVGLFMFAADGEPGAEVYSGAGSEAQAWEVFGPAREMAKLTLPLLAHYGIEVLAKSLVRVHDMSKFLTMIGNPGDGASPHCSITDEYHEHATDAQLSAMETGMGAREQPMSWVISTAGDNLAGPCREDWLMCQKMLQGIIPDDRLFALIYTVDKGDDWTSEESLRKANPNYGVSANAERLQAAQRDAINSPRKQGAFKTKHLNIWVQARDGYFNLQWWQKCTKDSLRIEACKGLRCIMAGDFASKVDLVCVGLLFEVGPRRYRWFPRFYLPSETVNRKENQHYKEWELAARLRVTDGNIIDFTEIRDDILADAKEYGASEFVYDPFQATMLINELMDEGLTCVEYGATVENFSDPMKECDALMKDGRIEHDGCPVMEFCVSNVQAKADKKDNVFPTKERAENKIDGAVTLVMAVGRMMQPVEDTQSVYEKRGLLEVNL